MVRHLSSPCAQLGPEPTLSEEPQVRDLEWPFVLLVLRELRFGERCFTCSAIFLDSRIVSVSFALARRVICRRSPVSAILTAYSFRLNRHECAATTFLFHP